MMRDEMIDAGLIEPMALSIPRGLDGARACCPCAADA